jgi:hypothetical protein
MGLQAAFPAFNATDQRELAASGLALVNKDPYSFSLIMRRLRRIEP